MSELCEWQYTFLRHLRLPSFIQHGKDSLGSICMFGIEGKHLEPIHSVAKKFGPTYNPEKLGAWGILFLCCGAMAGR